MVIEYVLSYKAEVVFLNYFKYVCPLGKPGNKLIGNLAICLYVKREVWMIEVHPGKDQFSLFSSLKCTGESNGFSMIKGL